MAAQFSTSCLDADLHCLWPSNHSLQGDSMLFVLGTVRRHLRGRPQASREPRTQPMQGGEEAIPMSKHKEGDFRLLNKK